MVGSPSSSEVIRLHLSRKRAADMTRMVVARLKYLRQVASGEQDGGFGRDEARERIRVLGEFMNSLNRLPKPHPDTDLPSHAFHATAHDLDRLNEELTVLYGVVRPKAVDEIIDSDSKETALALAGWAHRSNSPEELAAALEDTDVI